MTLPKHFLVSDSDGHLYDTRKEGWHLKEPLRKNYHRLKQTIDTTSDLKASLRAFYLTGYPLAFITKDGALLSYEAVMDNLYLAIDSIRNDHNDGWRIVGLTMLHSGEEVEYCDHTGEPINGD